MTSMLWKKDARYIVGIDEAGRGPLAGPVAVGALAVSCEHLPLFRRTFRSVKDSKQLSEAQREQWWHVLYRARKEGWIRFSVSLVGAHIIDEKGITYAIHRGLRSSLARLACPHEKTHVLLDGGLKAPRAYRMQSTIIKGDEKEAVIALASIVAKVTRDRAMERFDTQHGGYGFATHKGYGTKMHYEAIRKNGVCGIHRTSFLKRVL